MKTSLLLLILIALFGCTPKKTDKKNKVNKQPLWSVQFAESAMHQADSLIHYQANTPRYGYDYCFLGDAIYKLNNIDAKYGNYLKNYIDYFLHEDGSIEGYKLSDYNIDKIRGGNSMITLYKKYGDEKYKKGIETLLKQVKSQPRTKSGGFWHKKRYPYQMWLDGLYMACPFLARYAKEFNQPQWFNEVTFQLQEVYRNTLDKKTGLVRHAWDESRQQRWCDNQTGQSKHYWSRATGWYMMAMVDVLEYLPENHSQRDSIISILNKLSEALLKVRDSKTGLWYQVLDMGEKEGNYLEASGSAMFIYAFAKGAKNGWIDKKYLTIAHEAFNSLTKNLVKKDKDGYTILTNTCGACGLGGNPYREGDYNYYVTERKIDNDRKGVAPAILAAIELGE